MAPNSKLLRLPDRGRLLVAADLHGNLRDFLAITAMFERLRRDGDDAFLLFLGDVLHGPYLPFPRWQSDERNSGLGGLLRGRPYRDQSPNILLELGELMTRYPGRVATLLGNHEHAHIGGPRTSLFARDEAMALEQRLGVEASLWLAGFLRGLPLWAISACGVLFSHAAPAGDLVRLQDLEAIDYRRYAPPRVTRREAGSGSDAPAMRNGRTAAAPEPAARLLGQLLWTPAMPPQQAREVLSRAGARVAVYGHAVIPTGYQTIGSEQLILSTSFGMEDACKRVLLLDLSRSYQSTADLRPGIELLPLYPELGPTLGPTSGPTLGPDT
jgi:hypothetical protein